MASPTNLIAPAEPKEQKLIGWINWLAILVAIVASLSLGGHDCDCSLHGDEMAETCALWMPIVTSVASFTLKIVNYTTALFASLK